MKQVDLAAIAELSAQQCLATRVRQLSRIISHVYDDAMRPFGITACQYTLLARIASVDGILAVDIVRELDIEKSTMSRNMKRLMVSEMVLAGERNGRQGTQLFLTQHGKDTLRKAFPAWKDTQENMQSIVGDGAKTVFDNLIHKAESLRQIAIVPKRSRRPREKMAPELVHA